MISDNSLSLLNVFYSPPAGVRAGQGGGAGVGIILGGDCFHLI